MPNEKGAGTPEEATNDSTKLQRDIDDVFRRLDEMAKKSQTLWRPTERNGFYYYPDQFTHTTAEKLPSELKAILEMQRIVLPDALGIDLSYSLYTDIAREPNDHFTLTWPSSYWSDLSVLHVSPAQRSKDKLASRIIDTILIQSKPPTLSSQKRQSMRLFPRHFGEDPEDISNFLLDHPYNQLNILSGLASLFPEPNPEAQISEESPDSRLNGA